MLTPEQIAALRDWAGHIADPINDFLLEDIARRIAKAGQLTSSASYQIWRAQELGLSQREIKKRLRELLKVSNKELKKLLTQSAQVGYDFDLKRLPHAGAVPFAQNESLQEIVRSAVALAEESLQNITQTIGMVDPYGKALPLQDAYRSCMDYAFKQVITGAADQNTAIRRATKNLADKGVRHIDYESGVHTSLEAATRRNIMGGLGLMQEQITAATHDEMGCDGWEISAHANSAPDHEPIQGKQYSDAEYQALNNSLVRRISTLNCGHVAFPIILGVNEPQYTPIMPRALPTTGSTTPATRPRSCSESWSAPCGSRKTAFWSTRPPAMPTSWRPRRFASVLPHRNTAGFLMLQDSEQSQSEPMSPASVGGNPGGLRTLIRGLKLLRIPCMMLVAATRT